MAEQAWWEPDNFDVIDTLHNNISLSNVRERLAQSDQLRAKYARARSRSGSLRTVEIPLVVRPVDKDTIDGGEVILIGEVTSWPAGTAEKILHGELRVATATFRSNRKWTVGPIAKSQRFRRHSLMQISIQQAETQGVRPLMEDRYVIHLFNDIAVFAVLDGHGGTTAADFAANLLIPTLRSEFEKILGWGANVNFTDSNPQPPDAIEAETVKLLRESLVEAISRIEQETLKYLKCENDFSGTTLCVCICTRNTLIVANLGDSRVYVSRNGITRQVTKRDHNTREEHELARIEREGGFVNREGYLGGLVQVSRAIGDLDPSSMEKIKGLSAVPDIIEFSFDKEKDEFVLVGCDGLWEVMHGQAAVGFVRKSLKDSNGDLLKAADGLVKEAIEAKTSDNVTVVIAFLPSASRIWTKPPVSPAMDDDENRPRLFKKVTN